MKKIGGLVLTLVMLTMCIVGYLLATHFYEEEKTNKEETELEKDYITTTNLKILLNRTTDYNLYANIEVVDGKLEVMTSRYKYTDKEVIDETYNKQTKTLEIDGEKVKYIHSDYYQPSGTIVIYALTESKNLYVNEYALSDKGIDLINNFKKMNYTNVEGLVKVKNDNYGKYDEAGMKDTKEFYIYAIINHQKVKLENQYRG